MRRRSLLALLAALPVAARSAPFPVPVLRPPQTGLRVFHLGHSLVGSDMPHMLQQLAPAGHDWQAQLGSGTSLKEHWEPQLPIRDFEIANATPHYRDAHEAIGSGAYDAVVLTEMVELRDALRYFHSRRYLRRWANLARKAAPTTRIYLYETWHSLDDPQGWLHRLDQDLEHLWLGRLLGSDSRRNPNHPIYLIPAGQVLAAVVRAAEAGHIDGLTRREDLFLRQEDGALDTIHINDLGRYIVALTHYAVLYHRAPIGLAHRLLRLDGTPAMALSHRAAQQVQALVWQVVQATPRSGVQTTKEP